MAVFNTIFATLAPGRYIYRFVLCSLLLDFVRFRILADIVENIMKWVTGMSEMENPTTWPKKIFTDTGVDISYREFGDPNGSPILYFHGVPSSSLHGSFFASAATYLAVRLISVDRPGLGESDYYSAYTVRGWAENILSMTEEWKSKKFSVIGFSGGGPYAAGCAYVMPSRLEKVAIVNGIGPAYMDDFYEVMKDRSKKDTECTADFPLP